MYRVSSLGLSVTAFREQPCLWRRKVPDTTTPWSVITYEDKGEIMAAFLPAYRLTASRERLYQVEVENVTLVVIRGAELGDGVLGYPEIMPGDLLETDGGTWEVLDREINDMVGLLYLTVRRREG